MLNLAARLLPIHGKATILLKMLGGAMRKRTKADPKPWYIENIQMWTEFVILPYPHQVNSTCIMLRVGLTP